MRHQHTVWGLTKSAIHSLDWFFVNWILTLESTWSRFNLEKHVRQIASFHKSRVKHEQSFKLPLRGRRRCNPSEKKTNSYSDSEIFPKQGWRVPTDGGVFFCAFQMDQPQLVLELWKSGPAKKDTKSSFTYTFWGDWCWISLCCFNSDLSSQIGYNWRGVYQAHFVQLQLERCFDDLLIFVAPRTKSNIRAINAMFKKLMAFFTKHQQNHLETGTFVFSNTKATCLPKNSTALATNPLQPYPGILQTDGPTHHRRPRFLVDTSTITATHL